MFITTWSALLKFYFLSNVIMDNSRSGSGAGEDNVGIPDDLRCKRSDGKQWRCTAMSMPDKTVCEKHYIQAKKRAANSALKASMKKKRKPLEDNDVYLESKNDDVDLPLTSSKIGEFSISASGKKKNKEKVMKGHISHSIDPQPMRGLSLRTSVKSKEDLQMDGIVPDDTRKAYRRTPPSGLDSPKSRPQKALDSSPISDNSHGSSDSSDDTGTQPCHQCRRNDRDTVIWCLKCNRRGYCDICISTWYSDMLLEEIRKVCPACRGSCSCKVCLRGDNLIKARIREIPAKDKLQYLYCLLAAVCPVVNHIHRGHCRELEMEKRFRGNNMDIARTKLKSDEQMCCNFCRAPITDYHRHCLNCSYDLCLSCCKDIREATTRNQTFGEDDDKETVSEQVELSDAQLTLLTRNSDWRANSDGSIPCPPKEYGGCSSSILTLKRIFKMNWVASILKDAEEMVSGCGVSDAGMKEKAGSDRRLLQAAHREDGNDNYLYHPFSQDLRSEGIGNFRVHWSQGHPVIVKKVCDTVSMTIWDPMIVWGGVRDAAEEKPKDGNRTVKAMDCFSWTERDIGLDEFIRGYSEGRVNENDWPEMLKLKDWPSPGAAEEFLMYQRPDFTSKLPLFEFIHSKWGLLNVAAKLPHYSLQNDVGPKFLISYGTYEELGMGDSVENLHLNMRDMVFILVHSREMKLKGRQKTKLEKEQNAVAESEGSGFSGDPKISVVGGPFRSMTSGRGREEDDQTNWDQEDNEKVVDQENGSSFNGENGIFNCQDLNGDGEKSSESSPPGALWDVFRRQDVPYLTKFLRKEFNLSDSNGVMNDPVLHPLYTGAIYLKSHHKRKLKEEFGIEPWSFEQHLGEAVFIPAGCPFQVRNLQSTVQLGLDFLSPESLTEANRLADEIRGLPNDHEAKLQILEVGKISLYAASWAIKEVQKLVLDPKLGSELGFEDPNLTALVSENLEQMVKRRQIACV